MEIDSGFLDTKFLLREAQIDAAFLALEGADDLGFGRLHPGLFDVIFRGAEIALILLGGDAGVSDGLIEGGLRLLEGGLFFVELLLGAAGIETDHGIADLDGASGRRLPDDPEGRNVHGRYDLDRALSLELATAADDDGEVALAGGGGGQVPGGLHLPHLVNSSGGGCQDQDNDEQSDPKTRGTARFRGCCGLLGRGFD